MIESIASVGGDAVLVAAPVGSAVVADELVETAVQTVGAVDVMVTNASVLRDGVL